MSLPNNTYYHQGALINNNRHQNNLKNRIDRLEKIISNLEDELLNVNNRISQLSNKQIKEST